MQKTLQIVLFLALSSSFIAVAQTKDTLNGWQYVTSDAEQRFFIDPSRAKTWDGMLFRVWVKVMPRDEHLGAIRLRKTEKSKRFVRFDEWNKPVYEYKWYDKYESTLLLYEVDCQRDLLRIIGKTDYAADGDVISSEEDQSAKWIYFTPETVSEAIGRYVCR
jgi:hypothetical protein